MPIDRWFVQKSQNGVFPFHSYSTKPEGNMLILPLNFWHEFCISASFWGLLRRNLVYILLLMSSHFFSDAWCVKSQGPWYPITKMSTSKTHLFLYLQLSTHISMYRIFTVHTNIYIYTVYIFIMYIYIYIHIAHHMYIE